MKTRLIIYSMLLFQFSIFIGYSNNPEISKYLKNLSAATNKEAVDDIASEIIVEGNTVHVMWMESKYAVPNPLYYCRSLDLGKTWQQPVLIGNLVDVQYASQANNRRLAVDGNNVHIAYCDYNYSETGTGRIYYARSTNNGASFEPLKILATTGGGYKAITRSFVKAANGKVAVAYVGDGAKTGVWALHSSNGGTTFTDTKVFEEGNDLADFYFDGNQMIFLHSYAYFYFGLHTGRVYVTISNNNGTIAVTNKVSVTFPEANLQREKCMARHDKHYAKKIAKSGNNIHVIFEGQTETAGWTILYARSTNNGSTFEKAIDINSGTISNIQGGQETILANNGNVYIAYPSTQEPVYFSYSNNNGNTFSKSMRITPADVSHISGAWWIGLVNDPADVSGKSFYLTGNYMYSAKSVDGGKSFSKFSIAAPFLKSVMSGIRNDMVLDSKGGMHWISETKLKNGTDIDIMYRNVLMEPEPGNVNKALSIKNVKTSYEMENVVVPSSSTINFDSAMTAEAWVKFPPGNEDAINILAKIDGLGNWDYLPSGYNMGFRINAGKLCINSGIKTDNGDFINWGDCTIADTLWHHVAFTYDANAGVNNFKTYIDGIMLVQQTVIGRIIHNEGLLFIGVRMATASWYTTQNYYIDDVRLWNKALSQTELIANQVKKFTGKEEGLKLYMNFDDTFKDISGNGNDGIPIYNGFLPNSDFNPPITDFEMYQTGKEISFNNKTTNGTSFYWDFGNKVNSTQGNPRYTYPTPGEYKITLFSKNSNSVTTAIKEASIAGLKDFSPKIAWNTGFFTLDVFGGGFKENSNLVIKHPEFGEIAASNIARDLQNGTITGVFDLHGVKIGNWEVVVRTGASDLVSSGLLKIETGQKLNLDLNFVSSSAMLVNRWQTNILTISNRSPVDAVGVLLWVVYENDPDLDLKFLNLKFSPHREAVELGLENMLLGIDPFEVIDSIHGFSKPQKVYPIYFPLIKANSTTDIQIRMVSKKAGKNFNLKAWINPPMYQSPINGSTIDCMVHALIRYGFRTGVDVLPFAPCIRLAPELGFENAVYPDFKPPTPQVGIIDTRSFKYIAVTRIFKCLSSIFIPLTGAKAVITAILNSGELYQDISDCYYGFEKLKFLDLKLGTLYSFDPNDKSGPVGYGSKNFIGNTQRLNYVIRFENMSTATAPAQEVFITDTLNNQMFDIKDFTFGPVGFGDTIITAIKGQYTFAHDVDLRPEKNIILRIVGQVDTVKSIVKWEFKSFDPKLMELTEDPFGGFLPPNKVSPEGEGFVSFNVGLKSIPKNNDKISNRASIIFDLNKPILTNTYENTFDLVNPVSKININNPTTKDTVFTVNIAGSDTGSGIQSYDVYVSENFGEFLPYKEVFGNSFSFKGVIGKKYRFYSLAIDNAGNREAKKSSPDAEVSITSSIQDNYILEKLIVYPSPSSFELFVEFYLPFEEFIDISMSDISGRELIRHDQIKCNSGLNVKNLDVTSLPDGFYNLSLKVGNRKVYKKVVVIK